MTRKVVIDCDPGIDAALALSLGFFAPKLDVLAVTAVEGNVAADQSTLNVQAVIEQIDAPRLPRVGAARPRTAGPDVDGRAFHGEDGLGNAGFVTSKLHHQHASDKVICDAIRSNPYDVTVVCLGPLTNLAAAFQRDAEVPTLIDQLVICGGAVHAPGNVTPTAEFRMYADPVSAREVLAAPVTKLLVPLDVTRNVPFTLDLLDQLPSPTTRSGIFYHKILPFFFRSFHQQMGLEHIYLDAVVTVMAVLEPDLFETHAWPVDVETTGSLTAGMTVFDRRGHPAHRPNASVAMTCDAESIRRRIVSGLQRTAS